MEISGGGGLGVGDDDAAYSFIIILIIILTVFFNFYKAKWFTPRFSLTGRKVCSSSSSGKGKVTNSGVGGLQRRGFSIIIVNDEDNGEEHLLKFSWQIGFPINRVGLLGWDYVLRPQKYGLAIILDRFCRKDSSSPCFFYFPCCNKNCNALSIFSPVFAEHWIINHGLSVT